MVLRAEIGDKRSVITPGFNHSQMHDSSACIALDGALLYAVAEERISRIKHDAGFTLCYLPLLINAANFGKFGKISFQRIAGRGIWLFSFFGQGSKLTVRVLGIPPGD